MLFVQKGYCRYDGKKCRHLKLGDCKAWCKKSKRQKRAYLRNEKTGMPKYISENSTANIKAPHWCPKM